MKQNDYTSTGQFSFIKERSKGFRLKKLEVYNWGTFDGKVWKFAPEGDTTLLTGDSGSGKSTLVDALVTLLVSPRRIGYNKAADASARERSVLSYVRGYYGQKYAYEGKGTPEALRDVKQYSVLLATFKDTVLNKTITLAVFFWFREPQGNPTRFYVVAPKELFIAKEFAGFRGDVRQLKAALRAGDCDVFDDYNHYAECYRKALGNLSPQAIDLFQQTISMKKVEALTGFVRGNMLEETDIMDEVDKLLVHYHSLNSAYEAVQKARNQMQLLEPICSNGREYTKQHNELDEARRGQDACEHWFATLKAHLYAEYITRLEREAASASAAVANAKALLNEIEIEIRRLGQEIFQKGGGALESLQAKLMRLEETLGRKQRDAARYLEHAKWLGLGLPNTHAAFTENVGHVAALRLRLPEQIDGAQAQLTDASVNLSNEEKQKKDIDEEIESLKGRTSNIPKELISLRRRMCNALSMVEEQVPFAGEMIEVNESETEWEGAIERLLHHFALSMLVSEEHYPAVSKWVNEQQLGARLVYYATKAWGGVLPSIHPDVVAGKLSVKQKTPFTQWLTRELSERYTHVCCRSIAAFRQEQRAITLTGQIKSATRHEKDDRRKLTDRTRYVLGFSNQKKIETLALKSVGLAEQIKGIRAKQAAAVNLLATLNKQETALSALSEFIEFSELDVQSAMGECSDCKRRIDALSKKENSVLTVLREQLAAMEAKKEKQTKRVDAANRDEHDASNQLGRIRKEQGDNNEMLQLETPLERLSYPYLEKNRTKWLGNTALTLENSAGQEKLYARRLSNACEGLQKSIADLKTDIVKGIIHFRHRFPVETRESDDTIESLPEFHRMLTQLLKDDLPKYEEHFKELLTLRVLQQIALFQMTLKQQYEKVKARIASINSSMQGIDYNPSRYIKLNCEDNPDAELRLFRNELKACTEGATGGFDDETLVTERFLQIKKIIERFRGREKETEADKRWTRKVTDVRNWFVFSASERWRETNEEYEHYSDSDGKSGGQKEKLAYTVLAASLVYNYGLHEDYINQSTFRLVVIDEAFLRVSDNAAEYGLKLFGQLQFQLVIVTPLLKIATIEPFIAHVGFVSHDDAAHKSSLMNIPIEVYKEKRKEWEAL